MDNNVPHGLSAWPPAGGEMGARIRAFDWEKTPLGPISDWAQSVKGTVDLMLASPLAMSLIWGAERVQIYNDAMRALMGMNHPDALGRAGFETWGGREPAEANHRRVFSGESVTLEEYPWTIVRNGWPEETFFTAYLTPVRDETGAVAGELVTAIETASAERVAHERRENEARLLAAAELVGLGWSYWRPGSSHVEWDARRKAIWGLSPGAPVDLETAIAAIHPDDRHKVEEIRAAVTNPAINSYRAEYRVIGIEDGVERWIRTQGCTYEPGNPKAFIGAVLDITEQKRIEEALRDQEGRLQAAIDLVGLSVYSWDLLAGTAVWDDRIKAIWGLPPEAKVNLALARSAVHPDDVSELDAVIARATDPQGDGIYRAEYRVIGIEDGVERWISSYGETAFVDGKARGFVGAVREITQEKHAEARLRESEARLKAAADLVKLGCYSWDPQTDKLQWDDNVRAMWSLPAGAPVDYDVWRAGIHPDDLARVEAAVLRCADPAGDGLYDIEYRVIGKTDGVERWIAMRGQTNFHNGAPVSFYGVALDVTDHKRAEEALARRVEARTREVEEANRQLRSQNDQREIAEAEVQQLQRLDAIGQITSGVAHDFNNLLSVVLTNARLLSHNLREPGDQEGIELIRAAAERGVNLTRHMLAFSRKQRLEPQEVDLNTKIVGMNDLLIATLGGTVPLQTALAADLWPALVDPTQIELVILNLALNARDAMPSGGILTLETCNAIIDGASGGPEGPVPGKYVGLTVSDNGIGIPDDVLPHVFEPFFTTKQPGTNSGLGLAQVIGFAKQSGGGIGIETRVGKGTSVRVFLPRAERIWVEHDQVSTDSHGSGMKATAKILVVDDDAAVLKTTLRLLDALGYSAIPAASGEEALQLLDSDSEIDLILADLAMPKMSGAEFAKTIKTTHPLPVILVTGYGNREALECFGEARILQKPYTEDELIGKIKAALNER